MKKPAYLVVAASLLALLVTPIAFAGAANGPQASASAKGSAAVNKQLKALKQRIAALEARQAPTSLPPSGPAGGDLNGTYPNPLLKNNAVTTAKIAPAAVTTPKLADFAVATEKIEVGAVNEGKLAESSVGTSKIVGGAVTSAKIGDGEVKTIDMALDSVGSTALKGMTAVIGGGVNIKAGEVKSDFVTCPQGSMVIGGGYAWADPEPNSIIASAPHQTLTNTTWVVQGMPTAGENVLFAWANCLAL